ncbi:KdsC family phosphatase [Xanthovirga aplysinae]|uniref:KdsC family phosphatase n=1 Tax=Xanthovirga aplysinae TaxID=2529853 RepID=UPI0012BCD258|nr:HAD-IIIA family hydrolase [Xanthovirga aplysinae]MTI30684.1 HAD-IIIA family hydrolase [Xanthovirga aplysinae]
MEEVLVRYSKDQIQKARKIKAIIFDVDGVLTDGGIIYDNVGNEFKKFNVKDGQIISHLKEQGILVGAITGRKSAVVKRRCEELKLNFHFHGVKDKLAVYEKIKAEFSLNNHDISYIGDDIIDLQVIVESGLGVCPSDAKLYVQKYADLICYSAGGSGVVREVADLVLASKGLLENIVKGYFSRT